MITAESIAARKEQLQADLKRIESDYNATAGAIQDCDYWLAVLNAEGASAPSVSEGVTDATLSEHNNP